jgi:hypothetical protein
MNVFLYHIYLAPLLPSRWDASSKRPGAYLDLDEWLADFLLSRLQPDKLALHSRPGLSQLLPRLVPDLLREVQVLQNHVRPSSTTG